MNSASIALAFTAGMVAAFNPCGFSLLPAYIGAFVSGDELDQSADRRVLRAISVAGSVSAGFVIVFATVGVVIGSIAGEIRQQLPWVTIVIGGLLIVAGAASIGGWKPRVAIRGPRFSTKTNDTKVMVGYGVTYAVASLSCTIGPFLAVTGTALDGSLFEGLASFVVYGLGMGVIILILSVASALAHTTVAKHMRRLSRIAPRVGGALMVFAGGYAIWYGRWELAVYDGNLSTDPVINRMENIRYGLVAGVEQIGSQRLALTVILTLAAAVAIIRIASGDRSESDSGSDDELGVLLLVEQQKNERDRQSGPSQSANTQVDRQPPMSERTDGEAHESINPESHDEE